MLLCIFQGGGSDGWVTGRRRDVDGAATGRRLKNAKGALPACQLAALNIDTDPSSKVKSFPNDND